VCEQPLGPTNVSIYNDDGFQMEVHRKIFCNANLFVDDKLNMGAKSSRVIIAFVVFLYTGTVRVRTGEVALELFRFAKR
jgi:hypothetical protein